MICHVAETRVRSLARQWRSTALLLAVSLCLVVGLALSATAAADQAPVPFTDLPPDAPYAEAFNALAELGIFQGDDVGTVRPHDPLERQEFLAVVLRLIDRADQAPIYAFLQTPFSDDEDVADWARGYINLGHAMGLIEGYPDGTFGPKRSVTAVEVYTMLLRALDLEAHLDGTWPAGPANLAADVGLLQGVGAAPNQAVTRWQMAVATVNAGMSSWGTGEDGGLAASRVTSLIETYDPVLHAVLAGDTQSVSGTFDVMLPNAQLVVVLDQGSHDHYEFDEQARVYLNRERLDGLSDGDQLATSLGLTRLQQGDAVLLDVSDGVIVRLRAFRDDLVDARLVNTQLTAGENQGTARLRPWQGDGWGDPLELGVERVSEVRLNGVTVTFSELHEARQVFAAQHQVGEPLVQVQVFGSRVEAGSTVIRLDVRTQPVVSGQVETTGVDLEGPYVVIGGLRIHYEGVAEADLSGHVDLLLNGAGVARVLLSGSELPAAGELLWGLALGAEQGADGRLVTLEVQTDAPGAADAVRALAGDVDGDNQPRVEAHALTAGAVVAVRLNALARVTDLYVAPLDDWEAPAWTVTDPPHTAGSDFVQWRLQLTRQVQEIIPMAGGERRFSTADLGDAVASDDALVLETDGAGFAASALGVADLLVEDVAEVLVLTRETFRHSGPADDDHELREGEIVRIIQVIIMESDS